MSLTLRQNPNLQLLYEQVEAALQAHRQFLNRPNRRKTPDEYEESVRLLSEIETALQLYREGVEQLFGQY